MSIGEARAHYMDMVREEREEKFWEAQADAVYNHHLLQEHLQAKEQIAAGRAVAPDADVAKQQALLESYRPAQQIRRDRWRYRQRVAEVAAAASKEGDDASEALFGDSDDEEGDNEAGASAGDAGSEEE